MGRGADAKPLSEVEFAAYDGARHAGMDRGAHDRRGGGAHQFRESKIVARLSQGAGFFRRRLQGPAADAAGLEPAAASADPAGGRTHGGFGFAAGRFPAPGLGTRYARHRSARNQMQAALKMERLRMWHRCLLAGTAVWLAAATPAGAVMRSEERRVGKECRSR